MAYHAGFVVSGEYRVMRVWIDADACPKAAKDQVVKFALKRRFEVLVAGQAQIKPAYSCVRLIVVPSGPDAADDYSGGACTAG